LTPESYKARYGNLAGLTVEEAWNDARLLDPSLPEAAPEDPEALKKALVALARDLRRMEDEWS
jgi:hypothetical protein